MKKLMTIFVMSLVGLLAFNAKADTKRIYIDIDNHENVTMTSGAIGTIPLVDGLNTVDLEDVYGNGSVSFEITAKDGCFLQNVTLQGQPEYFDAKTYYGSTYGNEGKTFKITTGVYAALRTASVTVKVDDPSLVYLCRAANPGEQVALTAGTNTVRFIPGTENVINVRNARGNYLSLPSVKYNGTAVPWTQYSDYSITVADGGVIDITAVDPNATKYHVGFASGCNLEAVSHVTVNNAAISSWQSGFDVLEGSDVSIAFDYAAYDITDVRVNGDSKSLYGSPLYIGGITEDQTVSFTASQKAAASRATFTVSNPAGVNIYRGTSVYDTPVDVTSSFTESFDNETQQYLIKAVADYAVISIVITRADGTTETPDIYGYGTTITVSDGDRVAVDAASLDDLRTATFTINLGGMEHFEGPVSAFNGTNHELVAGTNTFRFNPASAEESTVYIGTAGDLYSVILTRGGEETIIEKTDDSYIVREAKDGDVVDIIARDPNAPVFVPEPATVIFDSESNMDAIANVLKNNEDVNGWNDPNGFDALTKDYILIYFKPGYTDINCTVNGDKVTADLSPDQTYYTCRFQVPDEFTVVYVSAAAPVVEEKSKNVDFTVNIPAGVKITDVSGSTPEPIAVSESFTYAFKAEYNYVNIQAALGYNLKSVTVDTGVGTPYAYSINDNKVTYLNVDEGYKIDIVVEKSTTPVSGNFTVNVTGCPDYVVMQDDDRNTISLVRGTNKVALTASPMTVYVTGDGEHDLISVKVNNVEQNLIGTYYQLSLTKNDVVDIVAPEDSSAPTFTVIIKGDLDKIDYLEGEDGAEYDLSLGSNAIPYTPGTYTLYINETTPFYSVKIDGTPLELTKYKKFYFYEFEASAGSVLEVITDEPEAAPSFTINVSGNIAKIGRLQDENRTEYTVKLGENVYELPNATSTYNYMLSASSALYIVTKNGETIKPSYGSIYMFSVKAGDVIDIETEFPAVDYTVTWAFAGDATADMISAIQIGHGDKMTAETEGFEDYLTSFTVANGTQVQFWIDNSAAHLRSVKINGEENGTNTYQYFTVTDNTTVTIDAAAKKVYNYTIRTNDPRHTLVYQGTYGYSQNIELTAIDTEFEYNEITGKTGVSIGAKDGYYVEKVTMDGQTLAPEDGHYTVTPTENAIVDITIAEVARPYTAIFYIDDLDNYDYISLNRFRGTALSTADADCLPENGYNVFRFNDADVNAADAMGGFSLNVNVKEGHDAPVVYINGVKRTIDESGRIGGLMLNDGDVIKLYSGTPAIHEVVFETELDPSEVVITVDRITAHAPFTVSRAAANGTSQLLAGTEITIEVPSRSDAWVKVDGEPHRLDGAAYTFPASGNHKIEIGTGTVTSVISTILSEEGEHDVYSVQGILLIKNASAAQLRALKPGLYIVSGRKIRIR